MARHRNHISPPREPSLKERIGYSVDNIVRDMLMANPVVKKLEAQIKKDLMAAANKAKSTAAKAPVKKKGKR